MNLCWCISCVGEIVGAFLEVTASRMGPMASQTASTVRAAALRNQCLSLAKNCSIGFRSGEYLGRKNSLAPAALMARRTALPLWLPRLMGLSNRGRDVKYLGALRCVCQVHGCLRSRHQSPHDGGSREEPSMWTTHFAESAVQPHQRNGSAPRPRQGRLRRSDLERYPQNFMLWLLRSDQRARQS